MSAYLCSNLGFGTNVIVLICKETAGLRNNVHFYFTFAFQCYYLSAHTHTFIHTHRCVIWLFSPYLVRSVNRLVTFKWLGEKPNSQGLDNEWKFHANRCPALVVSLQ